MRSRILAAAAIIGLAAPAAFAEPPIDPSGHWDGTALVQNMSVGLQLDFVRSADGRVTGTISVPEQRLKGLPLQSVTIDGTSIRFQARDDQPFSGVISADATSIAGEIAMNGSPLPVSLKRTGEARIAPVPASAAISKDLEGTWTGTLGADGGLRLVLTLVNRPDGTSTGVLTNLDEGGLRIPVTIAQRGRDVSIETPVVASTFSGTLDANGAELTGTFRQGQVEMPLNFRRGSRP